MRVHAMRIVLLAMASLCGAGNVVAASGDARLVEAVKDRDHASVQALLRDKPDVNAAQPDGTTALAWATHWNDMETVRLLIGAGADVNAANDYGVTPLSLACTNGNSDLVDLLLSTGANPNIAQLSGETPLMTCSRTGSAKAVKLLLERGADPNAKDSDRGQTALMRAAAQKQSAVVQLLVDHKADVNATSRVLEMYTPMVSVTYSKNVYFPKTKGGFTALMFAAQSGDLASARILVDGGADLNAGTPDAGTPLLIAGLNGREDVALFLLERGANPNVTDGWGLTPLHWALQDGIRELYGGGSTGTDEFWIHHNMPELVKALLVRGADPNAKMSKDFMPYDIHRFSRAMGNNLPQLHLAGTTPFMLATATGDLPIMRVLVEGRADPKIITAQGTTPLMVASGVGRERDARTDQQLKDMLEAVKLAVMLGGDINAVDKNGRTALHGAAYLGAKEVIKYLAEHGANLEAKDKYGQTAMTIALGDPEGLVYRQLPGDAFDYSFRQPGAKGNKEVADLLLSLGAAPFTGKYRDRSAE